MPHASRVQKAAYMRAYHHRRKNDPKYQSDKRKSTKKYRRKLRKWLQDLKAYYGCARCPERDPRCLTFHHLRDKSFNIGRSIDRSAGWDSVLTEVEKCEILCANCHAKEHIPFASYLEDDE